MTNPMQVKFAGDPPKAGSGAVISSVTPGKFTSCFTDYSFILFYILFSIVSYSRQVYILPYSNNNTILLGASHKLFVGMLPRHYTEEDVKPLFQSFGEIKDCNVLRNNDGQSKGNSTTPQCQT